MRRHAPHRKAMLHSETCAPADVAISGKFGFRYSFVIRHSSFVILSVALLHAPSVAHAHGELLIRIAAASREIATNPAPRLYLQRGELHRQDQNWDAAELDYARAADGRVPVDEVDLCRAQLFADRNQLDRSRELLTRLIELNPRNPKALLARARILVRLHESRGAIVDFHRAADCGAELESAAWLEWAQMLVAENHSSDALAVLDQGLRKTGAISTLQVYAVDLELAHNNTARALERLQTIIDNADRKERWFARRGEIQLSAGDRLAARESYAAAIAAIKRLPKILQATPATLRLKSQIDASLAGMAVDHSRSEVGVR